MGLRETQTLLARLFTDEEARRAYFDDPLAAARRFGLSASEAESLTMLDRREVEDFAASLLGKRALDARKLLPLTGKTLGRAFDALLFEAIKGHAAGDRRADAAALSALLSSRRMEPAWIGDLARYEMAFIAAARPGALFLARRFLWPVDDIARRLLSDADASVAPRRRIGLWLRLPGGRLRWWVF